MRVLLAVGSAVDIAVVACPGYRTERVGLTVWAGFRGCDRSLCMFRAENTNAVGTVCGTLVGLPPGQQRPCS